MYTGKWAPYWNMNFRSPLLSDIPLMMVVVIKAMLCHDAYEYLGSAIAPLIPSANAGTITRKWHGAAC